MHFLAVLLLLCDSSLSFPVPIETTIVQVQQWGVVGAQRVMEQVLLNGASLTGTSQEIERILQSMSTDALLPVLINVNQTSLPRNNTILRSRECILEGSQLHSTDHVFCDGTVYLTLEHNGTWTAHVPQALALKVLWDQDVQRTRTERIRLQEGCVKLMRELRLSEEQSVPETPLLPFLILVFSVLVCIGLIIVTFLLSKKHGLRHPGAGVIGSIIHYPKDMTEVAQNEIKPSGYCTL